MRWKGVTRIIATKIDFCSVHGKGTGQGHGEMGRGRIILMCQIDATPARIIYELKTVISPILVEFLREGEIVIHGVPGVLTGFCCLFTCGDMKTVSSGITHAHGSLGTRSVQRFRRDGQYIAGDQDVSIV